MAHGSFPEIKQRKVNYVLVYEQKSNQNNQARIASCKTATPILIEFFTHSTHLKLDGWIKNVRKSASLAGGDRI